MLEARGVGVKEAILWKQAKGITSSAEGKGALGWDRRSQGWSMWREEDPSRTKSKMRSKPQLKQFRFGRKQENGYNSQASCELGGKK